MTLKKILALACSVQILAACSPSNQTPAEFKLLPTPTSFEIQGNSDLSPSELKQSFQNAYKGMVEGQDLASWTDPKLSLELQADTFSNPEAYQLEIQNDQVKIQAGTPAGLWYGLMTLGQIIEDAEDQEVNLPSIQIEDAPALSYRAVHWDVKHHLEQKDYYFQLLDRLAFQKINAVIVEIEDKLQYQLQPKVGSSDAFSIEEWQEISAYALARNIRISPLVQGLGHASFILKHPEYLELRDDPESDWAFNPLDERTYQVQFDLYEDALKAFPYATYLHVGGDEVHTTGRNSGKSPLELQLTWLNRVSAYAEQKGLTPIFWDDMPLKNAGLYRSIYNTQLSEAQVDSIWAANSSNLDEFVGMFPKNCVYMRWNYDTPESPGNEKAMNWFTQNGFKVMGATAGQTRWNLMPQSESNAKNIRDFALISIRNQADGLLLTLWDDDSPHFELYGRGIANFAEYTWAGDKKSIDEVKKAYRQRAFGPALSSDEYEFIDSLELAVAFWKNALLDPKQDRNRLRSKSNPMEESLIALPNLDSAGAWTGKYEEKIKLAQVNQERVEAVLGQIAESKKLAKRNSFTLDVYEQVAQSVQFSNRALMTLAELDEPTGENRNQALQKLAGLAEEWNAIEKNLESVYGKTRQLNKPEDYILDQDHHVHLANQAKKFSDWQFYVEDLFVEKVKSIQE
ncbi:family 20 glycosylhydrolase [Algoriphagus sp. CAU 1675]|uniref:family 20 glycosylhydrolase n=1 Tax=Algoriphagus sp. CAU 1675 TaxID=3032597 RepID=UPI0023D9AF39|nr:family 20 glycosylhydrolase [Algoriphagus sp. CAU 1675]MDF2158338.1 family 20 glycosylhydrolase [Algoriphagus sp. CAU 1675]